MFFRFPHQIDDLSREVAKLKDALNSLSQLSYSSGPPSKRLQQNQQLETLQQQIKQLQYQLAVRSDADVWMEHARITGLNCEMWIHLMLFFPGVKEAAP